MHFSLKDFICESNRIEGILRSPLSAEITAHERFLACSGISIRELSDFVAIVAPGKLLREREGMNVRVGGHIAPPGGDGVLMALSKLVQQIGRRELTPYQAHLEYETLHPFMDGNGRSGRVLWLWMMGGIDRAPLGFLHTFYYQTLDAIDGRATE